MKNKAIKIVAIISTILFITLTLAFITSIISKEVFAADTDTEGSGAGIDIEDTGAGNARFYIKPDGYNNEKSLAGIFAAMKAYGQHWINLDTSDESLSGYGGEATEEYQNGMIHNIGALCFGHQTQGNDTTISEKISIIDIDYNSPVNELKLAYMVYQSRSAEEKNNKSTWKQMMVRWLRTYSKNYDIKAQSKEVGTSYAGINKMNEYVNKLSNRKFEVKKVTGENGTNIITEGDYSFIGPIRVKVGTFPIRGYRVEIDGKTKPNKEDYYTEYTTSIGGREDTIKNLKADEFKEIYLKIPKQTIEEKTKVSVTFTQTIESYYKAKVVISQPNVKSGQNICIFNAYDATTEETKTINFNATEDKDYTLKIKKVDEDTNIALRSVGFKVKDSKGNYLFKDYGKIYATSTKPEDGTEFYTDSRGIIQIKGLSKGDYTIYEWSNPNSGYVEPNHKEIIARVGLGPGNHDIISSDKVEIENGEDIVTVKIKNKMQYIDVEGNVWEDIYSGKQSDRNNLLGDEDKLLANVKVRLVDNNGNKVNNLKDREGNIIETEKSTDKYGYYSFENININDLGKYHIEFEYNGLGYEAVEAFKGNEDYSIVSVANEKDRDKLNMQCTQVDGENSTNSVLMSYYDEDNKYYGSTDVYYTKGTRGEVKYDYTNNNAETEIKYGYEDYGDKPPVYIQYADYTDKHTKWTITATTDNLQVFYYNHMKDFNEERCISGINLGLYKREQPDLSIVKDVNNIEISVNGKTHQYNYNQRFNGDAPSVDDLDNLGVSYKNKFNLSYSRPIYRADYIYNNTNIDKNLKVYITYQIRIINESSSLNLKVNNITDCYDSNYTLINAYNNEDEESLPILAAPTRDGYNSRKIRTAPEGKEINEIESGKSKDIYVKFELNKNAIEKIIDNKENLDNYVEINSYSTYKNGEIYAGFDKDSMVGNLKPKDKTTYEDDSDSAPGIKLCWSSERSITGKVFLDSTSNELKTGEIRQGDGEYKEGELGISGVEVTLTETSGSGQVYTKTTDENGDFYISGYVPGDYTLTYTWGGQTYTLDDKQYTITVQDYKGTIYKEKDRANNKEWYKTVNPRYSDAMDNYDTEQEESKGSRKQIDSETTEIKRTEMESTTPTMGIGVENTYENVSNYLQNVDTSYNIVNIDFGIVERARQQIDIGKRVKTVKITLANGQVIADAKVILKGDVDGDGKITEQDLTEIKQYINKEIAFTEEQQLKADVSCDGYINIQDATEIDNCLKGIKEIKYQLDGDTIKGVTYMGPSKNNTPRNGYLKAEIDSELIQGSTLEIGYEIVVKNNSEVDYDTENYYKYGTIFEGEKKNKIIKTTPTGVYDYLDNSMAIDKDNKENSEWRTIEQRDYEDEYQTEKTIIENYFSHMNSLKIQDEEGQEETVDITNYTSSYEEYYQEIKEWSSENVQEARQKRLADKTILHNTQLENKLEPGESNTVNLYATKVLANNNEIDLNNDVEITQVERTSQTGRKVTPVNSVLYDKGETVTVIQATGENRDYTPIVMLTISLFTILGTGIVFIKNKIIK